MIDKCDIEYVLADEAKRRLTSKYAARDTARASYVNLAANYNNRARANYFAGLDYGLTC